jgi:phosphatidylglycerol---prolipoprotein diacylglyceryl transferase
VLGLTASIPSPSRNVFELGPLTIRVYGLMLLLGILAAILVAGRRWVKWGGDWDLVIRCSMWGVGFGIVGARVYHVITSWDEVPDEWWGVFAVWKGGLGIWGGIAAGVVAGAVVAHRARANVLLLADAFAPGILLAQVIGRLGNYFNQELFGKPTSLPWGLEIDPENRPAGYEADTTFQPIFLYEMIWNAIGVVGLLAVGRRLRPGGVFFLYVMWYSLGRATWEEHLRIDPSHHFAGMRLNGWIAIGVFLAGLAGFIWSQRRGRAGEEAASAAPASIGQR